MAEETDFDAIVVGAGLAGCVAAYELATAGKAVLVVERGNYAGAKNMTGGRIYAHSLKKIFPDFEKEAPIERKICHERISLMAPDSNFTIDFSSDEMEKEEQASYSVLHAPFDQWLAEKAEDAGAEFIYGIPVEGLIKDDSGKVCGVAAGEDGVALATVDREEAQHVAVELDRPVQVGDEQREAHAGDRASQPGPGTRVRGDQVVHRRGVRRLVAAECRRDQAGHAFTARALAGGRLVATGCGADAAG